MFNSESELLTGQKKRVETYFHNYFFMTISKNVPKMKS